MTCNVVNTPWVEEDLDSIIRWYESKRLGLGLEFLDRFEEFVKALENSPFKYKKVDNDIRKGLLNQFPYNVFFVIKDDNLILILAVVYSGRHPQFWKKRLGKGTIE